MTLITPKDHQQRTYPSTRLSLRQVPATPKLSIATAAVKSQRVVCELCRFNDQPVVWWVSCPRLAHQQGSTQSLKENPVTKTSLLKESFAHNEQQTEARSHHRKGIKNNPDICLNLDTFALEEKTVPTSNMPQKSSFKVLNTQQQKQQTSKANYFQQSISNATPSPPPPPIIRPHHHRSISALPALDYYDDCTGVADIVGTTSTPSAATGALPYVSSSVTCKRHCKQQQQQLLSHVSQQQQNMHHALSAQQHIYSHNLQHQQNSHPHQYNNCCSSFNIDHKLQMPLCMCGKQYHQQVPVPTAARENVAHVQAPTASSSQLTNLQIPNRVMAAPSTYYGKLKKLHLKSKIICYVV